MAMTRDQGEGMADGEMLTNGHELKVSRSPVFHHVGEIIKNN